jgi:hypothetical protein
MNSTLIAMMVLFGIMLVGRILYSRQMKKMRQSREKLRRFVRDRNQRPLGL